MISQLRLWHAGLLLLKIPNHKMKSHQKKAKTKTISINLSSLHYVMEAKFFPALHLTTSCTDDVRSRGQTEHMDELREVKIKVVSSRQNLKCIWKSGKVKT